MADLNTDDILNFFKNLNPDQAKKFFDSLINSSTSAKNALTDYVKKFADVDKITSDLKTTAEEAYKKIIAIQNIDFHNLISNISVGNRELMTMGLQVGLISEAIATGIRPDAFNSMGDAASGMNTDLSKSLDTLDKVAKIIPSFGIAPAIISGLKIFNEVAEPAKKLEYGLLATASASGELGDLLKEVGEDLSGLETKSVSYAEILYNVGNATGYNTEQIGRYAAELSKIPGALSTTIDLSKDGTEQMHLLQAAMEVASGTGQTFSTVVSEMDRVYKDFGTTGKASLEIFSRLSVVSQSLKLPFDLVKDYLQTTAGSFRMFGDNSQAALNILEKFGPALKESGLGPRAIEELTSSITKNVAEMGLAQKAFLSASTGGPGGLQGAYQIELLKKQGKTDDVEKLVEDSLKRQFGGKILTLEDAAKDASSAAQFAKQVQLITQGPTKLANTEGEAYRILEAMSKGETSKPFEKTTGEGALNDVMDVGNKIQERNYNQLVKISNNLDLQSQYASITANALTRQIAGVGIGEKAIQRTKIEATEQAATQKIIVGTGINATPTNEMDVAEAIKSRLDKLPNYIDELKTLTTQMMEGGRSRFDEQKDRLKDSVIFKQDDKIAQNQSKIDAVIADQAQSNKSVKKEDSITTTVPIEIVNVCPNCSKEIATEVAAKIVDGKLVKLEKDQAMHIHSGISGLP